VAWPALVGTREALAERFSKSGPGTPGAVRYPWRGGPGVERTGGMGMFDFFGDKEEHKHGKHDEHDDCEEKKHHHHEEDDD
jgi:hypothetical protein